MRLEGRYGMIAEKRGAEQLEARASCNLANRPWQKGGQKEKPEKYEARDAEEDGLR